MKIEQITKHRQRAPSRKSLETRARILNAAETLFSERGFEGASIREIAQLAGVQAALVHHHGGGKETLFATVVARRAEEIAALRTAALTRAKTAGALDLRTVLSCFVQPVLDRVLTGGPEWLAYGRLIAHVSADERWRPIAEANFDPTARLFMVEISRLLPNVPAERLSAAFVFSVSSMLSLCASRWRIEALAEDPPAHDLVETLLDFCEAGFLCTRRSAP